MFTLFNEKGQFIHDIQRAIISVKFDTIDQETYSHQGDAFSLHTPQQPQIQN